MTMDDIPADCFIPAEQCPALSSSFTVEGITGLLDRKSTPAATAKAPAISYGAAKEGVKYCMIMTDPDAPSREKPLFRNFCHWVQADCLGSPSEILAYVGPGPPCNSGLHRYVFCLYEQPSEADLDLLAKTLEGRGGSKPHDAAIAAGLGPLVAIEFYYAEWDESVDALHEAISFLPPPEYRSPAQKAKHGDA